MSLVYRSHSYPALLCASPGCTQEYDAGETEYFGEEQMLYELVESFGWKPITINRQRNEKYPFSFDLLDVADVNVDDSYDQNQRWACQKCVDRGMSVDSYKKKLVYDLYTDGYKAGKEVFESECPQFLYEHRMLVGSLKYDCICIQEGSLDIECHIVPGWVFLPSHEQSNSKKATHESPQISTIHPRRYR